MREENGFRPVIYGTKTLKKIDERILERRGQNVDVDNGIIITVLQTEVRRRAGVDCIMEVVRGKKIHGLVI